MFEFPGDELPQFVARTASRPSGTVEEIVIDYLNTKRYLAGKFEWGTMSIGLHDPIAPSSMQKVMDWVRLCYENISGRAGYAAFYKKDFSMIMLDPVGSPVEEWSIEGAWVTEFTPGDLDMATAEPLTLDLTLRYDRAVLQY